jgi:uncharacterized delta-60 repeat protein
MNTAKRVSAALSLGVAAVLLLAAALQASSLADLTSAVLDPGFNGDGIATLHIGDNQSFGSAVALQPDGRIVVAGTSLTGSNHAFAVVRYDTGGSLDSTFGSGGVVTTPLYGDGVYVADLVLQSDGKIIVVGSSGAYVNPVVALARYETDGTLDNNFGSSGIVTAPYGAGTNNSCSGVVLTSFDKYIVVAGTTWFSDYEFALARFDSDGNLDSSFGVGGIVTTDLAGDWDFGHAIALQPSDDKVVVAGRTRRGSHSDYDFALARYDFDGNLDGSFGNSGIVSTSVTSSFDSINGLAVQPDGKIVAAGLGDGGDVALARYNTNGTLDTSFDGDGIVTAAAHTSTEAYDVVIQPDGKIVVVGMIGVSLDSDVLLARFNGDGSLDTSFGGGMVITAIGTDSSEAHAAALQSDGKIMVTGFSANGMQQDIAVLRYGAYLVYLPLTLRNH